MRVKLDTVYSNKWVSVDDPQRTITIHLHYNKVIYLFTREDGSSEAIIETLDEVYDRLNGQTETAAQQVENDRSKRK